MITEKKILPGRPGSKKLCRRYGDDLVCVRYRYAPELDVKLKTVELVVERKPNEKRNHTPWNKKVMVRIDYGEVDLGVAVKNEGGRWNKEEKLWEIPYKSVKKLGLGDRIVRGKMIELGRVTWLSPRKQGRLEAFRKRLEIAKWLLLAIFMN